MCRRTNGYVSQPVAARSGPALDQRHLDVRLRHQRVGEGEAARTSPDDEIISLDLHVERIARSFLYALGMTVATMKPTKGERTRAAILEEAAQLSTVVGLEGLSIGGLAAATEMSKSGLYAHFGSKLDLQLATIEAARQTFVEEVLRPAFAAPRGRERLLAACEAFLSHVERGVFPGGGFFVAAAADVGTRPGPVRTDHRQQRAWLEVLERLIRETMERGELEPGADPAQLAFELQALLAAANNAYIRYGDAGAFERARAAIRERVPKADN